jgi:catechol 2,3-dioxygenase-like lactoylglutathione lyase family enzyme
MISNSGQNYFPANIAWVSIGVTDMPAVRALWVDELGLDVIARRQGPDDELGRLWDMPADQFEEQLLLATPGADTGFLHFVQFSAPGEAVREGAAPTDLGAKNLDVNCTDMPALVERLRAAGYAFRSAIGQYEIDGIEAREVQMPAHDGINVVLIEVLTDGFEVSYTARGFAALTSFVVIVPDVGREAGFYKKLFGMQEILRHRFSGAAIEMAAGLPAGTVLDLHLLGEQDNLFGRMELIEYVGVQGDNRFVRARPPATGILSCGFRVASLDEFARQAAEIGSAVSGRTKTDTLFAKGEVAQLTSPAGLQICLHQSGDLPAGS